MNVSVLRICFLTKVLPSSSWKTKSDKWLKTNSRWGQDHFGTTWSNIFQHTKPFKKNPNRNERTNLSDLTSSPLCASQGFNDGLEELCKIQKGWAIPDKEQRDFIRQSQKKVVSDVYRAFLQRWEGRRWKNISRGFDLCQLIHLSKVSLGDVITFDIIIHPVRSV